MKTIKTWFESISDPKIKTELLENMQFPNTEVLSLGSAMIAGVKKDDNHLLGFRHGLNGAQGKSLMNHPKYKSGHAAGVLEGNNQRRATV